MTDKVTEVAALIARLSELLAGNDLVRIPEPRPEPSPKLPERVLLSPEEAANRLGIGRTTMYRLIRTGEIVSVQIGRLRRIAASEIDEYAARLVARQPSRPAA